MDIWAICRKDHGLTWEEFQGLTLTQFEALEERRIVEVRYGRFNAGLVASFVYNTRITDAVDAVTPFDFIPGYTDPEAKEKERARAAAKADVYKALMRVSTSSPKKVKAVTKGLIQMLRESGFDDPEDLIREVFPEMEI